MKKILIITNIFVVALLHAQSLTTTENYIYSRTYLEPVTTEQSGAAQVQNVQYLDKLGRISQSVGIKVSPTGKDVVVPSAYDGFGRQTKNYLPLPLDSQNGAYVSTANENSVNSYYGVPNAYSEISYEKSPLGRVEKMAAPGSDWQITGSNTKRKEYIANAASEVKRFKATTSWNASAQINDVTLSFTPDNLYTTGNYFNAGTLHKVISKDEDNNEIQTFVNSEGQNVLVRKINKKDTGATENLDTYYVYDEFDNLVFIIPPKAAVLNTIAEINSKLNLLCYQYKYDKYDRLVEKRLPAKDWEYIVYDRQNRQVLAQDANLRTSTNTFGKIGWAYTKYDSSGRPVYTGFWDSTKTRAEAQSDVYNQSVNPLNNEKRTAAAFALNGMDVYYTQEAFPTVVRNILSVNYYDDYPQGSPSFLPQIQGQNTLPSAPTTIVSNGLSSIRSLKTLPTGSYVKNIENDNWTSGFIWYDTLGRVIGTYGKNHLGGFTSTESLLDFSGKTKEIYTSHSRNTSSVQTTVKDRFTYSPQNYLLKHYQQINANAEELLSDYTYNDLGQVTNKKVGNNLQSIDFTYNIRGWLNGINPDNINNLNSKLFSYKIKFNTVEGQETPNNSFTSLKVKPKYNGSISEIDWKTASGANEPLRRYGYVYDGTNRLRAGFFQVGTNPYTKEYSEVIDYDLNGNISSLNRTGGMVNGIAEVMDDLKYHYINDGNQLEKLEETGAGNGLSGYPLAQGMGNTISYDANGNMLNHTDKGYNNITYNFLNLPSRIGSSTRNKVIDYIYSASGSKVQMTRSGQITDYLGNFQYTDISGTPSSAILANEEGYFDFVNNRYVYQYKDHLGNIRLSYAKNSNGSPGILEENNYYPFGLKHAGYNTGDNTNNNYKYLYNGKELQNNGNLDYGWRQYMPDLGRWNGMDQLAETYHSASPYTYVFNNPVSLVDVDGRWMDEAGNIDTSGRATTGISARARYTQFLGTTDNQFAWGYIPFGDTQAYSDLMNAAKTKGATGGLSNIGGTLRWWTDLGFENEGLIGTLNMWKFSSDSWWSNIGNFFKNHFVFELEGKGTLGVQGGFRTSFGTAEAGIMTGDIGKFGISTRKGLYANYGDGKGHNFAGIGIGIKNVSAGIKADYVTNDWIPTAGDLLDYYPNNGAWDIEGNIGPKVNKGGVPNGSLSPTIDSKIKQRFRVGTTDACSGCIDMTFGIKMLLGIELRIRTGFTGF